MMDIYPLTDFLRTLKNSKGLTPYTWLIGAGMSVSANVPLAKEISEQLTILKYIIDVTGKKPWQSINDDFSLKNDLDDFFEWCSLSKDDPLFQKHQQESKNWLNTKPGFEDISIDDPECYNLLFKDLAHNPALIHIIITKLVNRAGGVNLAHLHT